METSFIHCRSVNECYQDYIKKLTTKTKYHSPQDFVYCPDGFFAIFSSPLMLLLDIYWAYVSAK